MTSMNAIQAPVTLTQTVQSYEPDFSKDYSGNFFLETPEVNSEPITAATIEKPRFAPPVTDTEMQELTETYRLLTCCVPLIKEKNSINFLFR